MPSLSGDTEFATVVAWLKKPGEQVEEGEPLLEVDSDKVSEEVAAPVTGTLVEILAESGDEVRVGAAVAVIDEGRA
jgi:2-oxoglutarate dehydrogenase E2 component (dihydrolipoamide succinyltransferase)